ncbi:MAG: histidine--tRNA ligase [Clostridia bacterium]|nr:histidine--tRNA ligase [Clostridia bacterium]
MKEIELRNVKGCTDYSPREQYIRNYISDTLKKVFEKYGFKPLQTPILCYYDLLALKYEEDSEILNEVYKVTDQADRSLALRYDLTVPFAKYIAINQNTKLPFKRYEIGEVFRNGPVKLGRVREFIQCDVDSVGIEGQLVEAEFVALYVEAYNNLGIDVVIKYNNRKFLSGIIIEAGISEELVTETITVIDKFEKLSKPELEKEFAKVGLNSEQMEKLLMYLNMDADQLINIENKNEILAEGIEELNTLKGYIENLGLLEYVQFAPSLARGQEYYTGTVFEAYVKDGSITSSIGGGGRYDKMITDFINNGTTYPAVGISFGLNVIYEILKNREEFTENALTDIFIIPMGTEIECLKIAEIMRKAGYKVEVEMRNRKMKKSLEYANEENIPYVFILGEDELAKQTITVKDMKAKAQTQISTTNILEEFNKVVDNSKKI